MINEKIQWAAIVATVVAGLIFLFYEQWWQAGLSLGVAIFLLYSRYRFGKVYMALRHLYRGNLNKCEEQLQKISRPDKLTTGHRAYYHFCWGYLKMSKKNFEDAQVHFEKALEFGIKLKNDQAVAHVSLADIFIRAGDKKSAKYHVTQAEELKHNEAVDNAIDQIRKQLK